MLIELKRRGRGKGEKVKQTQKEKRMTASLIEVKIVIS